MLLKYTNCLLNLNIEVFEEIHGIANSNITWVKAKVALLVGIQGSFLSAPPRSHAKRQKIGQKHCRGMQKAEAHTSQMT